jgi:hypothetical protein
MNAEIPTRECDSATLKFSRLPRELRTEDAMHHEKATTVEACLVSLRSANKQFFSVVLDGPAHTITLFLDGTFPQRQFPGTFVLHRY